MVEENKRLDNGLIIPKKESLFVKFLKWIVKIFGKNDELDELLNDKNDKKIIIPESIKTPEVVNDAKNMSECNLEYLCKLSDSQLDDLEHLYSNQIKDGKEEIIKLYNVLESYKQKVKKIQEDI